MIHLVKSTFYKEKETKQSLIDFISGASTLSMGKECAKFEKAFAKKQGRKYAVLVSSGSMANLILVQAMMNLGMFKKGDRIGVSALTWATNIMPLLQLGLVPVILDVSRTTLNVTPEEVEKKLGKLKGLFITNVLGLSDDISKIEKLCKKHRVTLIEDNCESLGSRTGGKLLGNFGIASTFSFFVGHHLSTIEGGMVTTDDDILHEMLVLVRAHGWDRNLHPDRQKKLRRKHGHDEFHAKYIFHDLAYNARPTEVTGFLGNTQLPHWNEIVKKRQSNFKRFASAIEKNKDLVPLEYGHMDTVSNMAMPVLAVSRAQAEIYKKKFAPHVEIRPVIAGNMLNQPFYKKYVSDLRRYDNAEFIHQNGFYFANNPELTNEEVSLIVSLLSS
ncbi:MAG: hypothetical protein JWN50_421 [Parcubacteria group bacterium]|nr:hypothetical protein [Parcubacteria group bacterium]